MRSVDAPRAAKTAPASAATSGAVPQPGHRRRRRPASLLRPSGKAFTSALLLVGTLLAARAPSAAAASATPTPASSAGFCDTTYCYSTNSQPTFTVSSLTPVATATPTPAPTNGVARPDLAGTRVQTPGSPDIYLVDDDGARRHVPDPTTYNNLFRDWSGIQAIDVSTITSGPDITSGASLATPPGGGPVYLVSNGQKRHVTSPAVMDKFWFSWGQVRQVPQSTLDGLPNGPDLT